MPPYDVLVFDLDGTISDPSEGLEKSINYALAHFGFAPIPPETLSKHIGPSIDRVFAPIAGGEASLVSELVRKFRERYGEIGYTESLLYDGMAEAIRTLRASGRRLGVCTIKRQDFAVKTLRLFGLEECFAFIHGGDVGMTKSRQLADLAAEGLVTPGSLMIGDRATDLLAAHSNGLSGAGVLWGHGTREELEAERPRHLFEAPSDLCSLAA